MNINEFFVVILLWIIKFYNNIKSCFKSVKPVDDKPDLSLVLDPDSDNDKQIEIEEIAEEVIDKILENYHLFKKEE